METKQHSQKEVFTQVVKVSGMLVSQYSLIRKQIKVRNKTQFFSSNPSSSLWVMTKGKMLDHNS